MLISSFTRVDRLVPNIEKFMEDTLAYPPLLPRQKGRAVLAWGCKHMDRATALSRKHNLPIWHAEEGFLRSVGLGIFHVPPVSLILDTVGIYYDATRPSTLESLLENGGWESPQLLERARRAIKLILHHDLSKFNTGRPAPEGVLHSPGGKRILLIDQTFADKSVGLGLAGPQSFAQMLEDALSRNPQSHIYIKTHPNVITGYAKGYFGGVTHPRVTLLGENYTPLSLLAQADEVYAVTSQMGFEALLLGKTVHCYGLPFYAGWGLTQDVLSCPRRTRRRTLEELFAAAYILYPRYLNTVTGERTDIFDAIRLLVAQKNATLRTSGAYACLAGYPGKYYARHFLHSPDTQLRIFSQTDAAVAWAREHQGTLVMWARRYLRSQGGEREKAGDVPLLLMEDGFIRSKGLGAKMNLPYSLVADSQGIYYNPQQPSALETLLAEHDFQADPDLLARARALRGRIVAQGVSKYNLPASRTHFEVPLDKTVILVPGQVEDDMSILLGAGEVRTNLALLQKVRRDNPQAFIVYKPHPDVEQAERQGRIPPELAAQYADYIADQADIGALLAVCHEVHTITSLTGFEALLREKIVCTYGGPFYAGWGLTRDHRTFPRRGRQLTLDELTAATLILYPLYYDWVTEQFCGPEDVLHRLAHPPRRTKVLAVKLFQLYQLARRVWLNIREVKRGLERRLGTH